MNCAPACRINRKKSPLLDCFQDDFFQAFGNFISALLFCSTGIILPRSDASLSGFSVPQGLFRPPECISIWLFCFTGIILPRSDASLSGFSAPQGLFRPPRFISILLFCSAGITLPQSDASLSCSFAPQRLFRPPGFISILLFCSTGIISAVRIHLYLTLLLHRDYFGRPNSSLSGFSAPQGLFRPPGFISIWIFCSTGIISAVRIHLYLPILLHRDYFGRPDSSLSDSFAPQGLFCPGQMHLYLALLLHRDYFGRPDSSLSSFSVPQGLFRPSGFISIWLFWHTNGMQVLFSPHFSYKLKT